MDQPDQEFTREILRKVRQIEIRSNRLVSEALADLSQCVQGTEIDFEEVREYQAGDEVRSIDWAANSRWNALRQTIQGGKTTILLAIT